MQIQVSHIDGSFEHSWHISSNVIPCSWTAQEFAGFTNGSKFSVLVTGRGPDGKINSQIEKTFEVKEIKSVKYR